MSKILTSFKVSCKYYIIIGWAAMKMMDLGCGTNLTYIGKTKRHLCVGCHELVHVSNAPRFEIKERFLTY